MQRAEFTVATSHVQGQTVSGLWSLVRIARFPWGTGSGSLQDAFVVQRSGPRKVELKEEIY